MAAVGVREMRSILQEIVKQLPQYSDGSRKCTLRNRSLGLT